MDEPHNFEIYGEFTHRLFCQIPVMLGDFSARVLSVEDDAAIVDLGDAVWPGDEDTHITQHIFSCDPTEIANQLNAFWLPIWRKFSDGRLTTKISRLAVYHPALSDASCHFD